MKCKCMIKKIIFIEKVISLLLSNRFLTFKSLNVFNCLLKIFHTVHKKIIIVTVVIDIIFSIIKFKIIIGINSFVYLIVLAWSLSIVD